MLNHIVLMGRLTRDPELRRTASGVAVASFSLAVDRDYGSNKETGEKETDFIDIVAWRSTAEFVSKYFSKGRMAVVSGRLQIRSWNDKEGNKRRSAEVVADNVYFGDSKRDSQSDGGYSQSYGGNRGSGYQAPSYQNPSYAAPAPAAAPVSDFAMLEDDDSELPF
jgi:single-strand DNA-binding protein